MSFPQSRNLFSFFAMIGFALILRCYRQGDHPASSRGTWKRPGVNLSPNLKWEGETCRLERYCCLL